MPDIRLTREELRMVVWALESAEEYATSEPTYLPDGLDVQQYLRLGPSLNRILYLGS